MKGLKFIFGVAVGLIISGIGVYALSINSKDITYNNTNVSDAIDDLYEKVGTGTGSWVKAIFTSRSQTNNTFPITFYDKDDNVVMTGVFGDATGNTHTINENTVFRANYIGGGTTSVTAVSGCTIDGVHYNPGETTPTEHYLVGHEYIIIPD